MICPACYGTGYKELRSHPFPCDVCESRGVIHCCEGDQASDPPVPVHPALDPKREHSTTADCWCGPVEVEDGVYVHFMVT
jgi:hypothetical protein